MCAWRATEKAPIGLISSVRALLASSKPKAEIRWHVGRDDAKNILETFDLVFPPARLSLLQDQPPCRMTWNAEPVRRQTRGQQEVRDSALDTVSMEQP